MGKCKGYKVVTKDGKEYVSIKWGAYVSGEDSGYVFESRKEAKSVMDICQKHYGGNLKLKEVAL